MYESLRRHSTADFTLYILPMDETCRWTLAEMNLPGVVLVDLKKFVRAMGLEEQQLSRTVAEWCWTCGSNLMEYLFATALLPAPYESQEPMLTYLDADLFFFLDPENVFNEIGDCSIAITPHRLIPSKKHLEVNGKFNVGWVSIRDNWAGHDCMIRWAQDCRDWCFNRVEEASLTRDGRFGDQKYLDSWPLKYGAEVCELGIGVNVAPWNVGNWTVSKDLEPGRNPRIDGVCIRCYHFHEFTEREDGTFRLSNYDLRTEDIALIYEPYILAYKEAKARIAKVSIQLQAERA